MSNAYYVLELLKNTFFFCLVVSLPELHYLRNKLWSSIFNLLNVLLQGVRSDNGNETKNKYDINALIMQLESRKESFLLSLCESISSNISNGKLLV